MTNSYSKSKLSAMNKLVLFLSVLLSLVNSDSIAQKPGDVSWTRLIDLGPTDDVIRSIKVQADGKIVAAGNRYQGSQAVIAIGRFDGGMLDTSFGINGIVPLSLDSSKTEANALEIQPDGKIIVAGGYYNKVTGTDFLLARFNPNGSPDSSFGINGIVLTDFGSSFSDYATALTIQTDGKIVAAGTSGSALALCRYNTNGSLDNSFDLDGMLTIAASVASCLKTQKDGKILVGFGSNIMRLKPDGARDYSFGTSTLPTFSGFCKAMTIQNDGKILVAGDQWHLERLDTTGTHDNTFGNNGKVTIGQFYPAPTAGRDATSVCLQADGRILAAGWAQYIAGNGACFAVARLQSNGTIDSSFGTFGTVASSALPDFYRATSYSAAINNNNELVLAGVNVPVTTNSEWALVSYYLGPPLDVHSVPSINGEIIVAPNPAEDFARIQSTHIGNGTWNLSLSDVSGRTVYTETLVVTNNAIDKNISLTNLPAAIYLVKLDNGISRMTVKLTKSR